MLKCKFNSQSFLCYTCENCWVENEFDVSSAIGKSSHCFDVRLVCFIWSTAAHGFNNSVHSKLGACVSIKVFFCSKGFSVTQSQTLPLSVSFQLHKGDMIFLFTRTSSPFSPRSIPDKNRGKLF